MEESEVNKKIADIFKRMIRVSTDGMTLHCGDCSTAFITELMPTIIKTEEGLPIFSVSLVCSKCEYDMKLLNKTQISGALEIELEKPLGEIIGDSDGNT